MIIRRNRKNIEEEAFYSIPRLNSATGLSNTKFLLIRSRYWLYFAVPYNWGLFLSIVPRVSPFSSHFSIRHIFPRLFG